MAAQKTSEKRVREETENFVQKSAVLLDEDSDLEEMEEDDDGEGMDGIAAFDKMTLQQLESLPLDPPHSTAVESGQIHTARKLTRKG